MKKKTIALLLLIIIALQFLPFSIPKPGWVNNGNYNTFSGLIWCKPADCVHEVGHKLDHLSNWPSSSDSFNTVVEDMGLDLWENEKENYARIFSLAKGRPENMPEILWPFYDWELAVNLMKKFDPTSWLH